MKKSTKEIIAAVVLNIIAAYLILSVHTREPGDIWIYLVVSTLCTYGVGALFVLSTFHDKLLTESHSTDVKAMLDRIVKEFESGPCTVIDLTFIHDDLRKAVDKRLTQEMFTEIYNEACGEIGMKPGHISYSYEDHYVHCIRTKDTSGEDCIHNIQVPDK